VGEKAIENPIERGNIGQIDFKYEAIPPRDSMALRHLRNLLCQVGDFGKLSWQGRIRTNAMRGYPKAAGLRSHAFIFHELIGVRKEFWVPLRFAGISITEERRSGVIQACLASPGFHRRGCERS
jgi:hypothetical protein